MHQDSQQSVHDKLCDVFSLLEPEGRFIRTCNGCHPHISRSVSAGCRDHHARVTLVLAEPT